MVIPQFIGNPTSGKYPFRVDFKNYSVNANSYTWNFGDGSTSTDENPSHYYNSAGQFTVSLTSRNTITSETDTLTRTNYIKSFSTEFNLNNYLSDGGVLVEDLPYKTCNKFTTIGWVKSPKYENGEYMIPLAVEDKDGNVLNTDNSLKFMLQRSEQDYKFVFNNSESQLIRKSTGIKIDDDNWHSLQWVCLDNSGTMKYVVDNIIVPNRTGVNSESLEYSIAYNKSERIGGGDVWCPYAYAAGQSITIFNWRFIDGLVLGDSWTKELIDIDKNYLGL